MSTKQNVHLECEFFNRFFSIFVKYLDSVCTEGPTRLSFVPRITVTLLLQIFFACGLTQSFAVILHMAVSVNKIIYIFRFAICWQSTNIFMLNMFFFLPAVGFTVSNTRASSFLPSRFVVHGVICRGLFKDLQCIVHIFIFQSFLRLMFVFCTYW